MYLDSIEETLAYYDNIDEPHDYVKYTPMLFNQWVQWAKSYKPTGDNAMRQFGIKVGPDWMKSEFDSLDTFYKHYINITQNY